MAFDPDEDDPERYDATPIRRSRTVRWTAILIVASFAATGLSSLLRWF